jgi:hypothetical protein
MSRQVRLERLVGRRVVAMNHRAIGRIEECRAERRGRAWELTAYVIGPAGLWERLGSSLRLLYGTRAVRGYLARWDQIDITDPSRPRLTCPVGEIQRLDSSVSG